MLAQPYDVAIGYLEKKTIYYVLDKVQAAKKIGWVHTDYANVAHDYPLNHACFHRLDTVVTVSEHSAKVLNNIFALPPAKIAIIRNLMDRELITRLAGEADIASRPDEHLLVTVGRLIPEKGIDIAINACKILVDRGWKIKWLVVGDGSAKPALLEQIQALQLGEHFVLVGAKANPYPYMRCAELYVQPSRNEGFGITIAEAMVFRKPIIASQISAFAEQIVHGTNGLLCPLEPEAFAQAIESVLVDARLGEQFATALAAVIPDNASDLTKLYTILDDTEAGR